MKATAKKQRKVGSGRKATMPAELAKVDRAKLKALIDKHDGVVLSMVDDIVGLDAVGLEAERPLSRVTLGTRLNAIADFEGQPTALIYANVIRVRAGKPGPRNAKEAKQTAADMEAERAKVVDVMARSVTKEAAAIVLGLRSRRRLNERVEELGIDGLDIEKRKREILTCPGCKGDGEHVCGSAVHAE